MILASPDRKKIVTEIGFGFACYANSTPIRHDHISAFDCIGLLPTYEEALRWLKGDPHIIPIRIVKSGEVGNV